MSRNMYASLLSFESVYSSREKPIQHFTQNSDKHQAKETVRKTAAFATN